MPALGNGFSISFSLDLCHAAGLKYMQASLLHSCLQDKAEQALMQLQACLLNIHYTTLKGRIAGIQPKDLDWANHIVQCLW